MIYGAAAYATTEYGGIRAVSDDSVVTPTPSTNILQIKVEIREVKPRVE